MTFEQSNFAVLAICCVPLVTTCSTSNNVLSNHNMFSVSFVTHRNCWERQRWRVMSSRKPVNDVDYYCHFLSIFVYILMNLIEKYYLMLWKSENKPQKWRTDLIHMILCAWSQNYKGNFNFFIKIAQEFLLTKSKHHNYTFY